MSEDTSNATTDETAPSDEAETDDSINTSQLARELAKSPVGQSLKLSQAAALSLIQTTVHIVTAALAEKKDVRVHQFGVFKVLPTQGRKGRNPRTGEEIDIEAGHRVHFVVAAAVKEAARTGKAPELEAKTPAAPTARAPKATPPAAPAKPAAAAPAKNGSAKSSGKGSGKGAAKPATAPQAAPTGSPASFKPDSEESENL